MLEAAIERIRIERIVPGGDGLGRLEGKALFVPGTAPGELVTVRVNEDRGSYARAELLGIEEPSPFRVSPICPLYQSCGGCTLQHVAYEAQLEAKRSILAESIERAGVKTSIAVSAIPGPAFGYRNRMQFHRARSKGKKDGAGLVSRDSSAIVAVSDCPIAVSPIREALTAGILRPPPHLDRFSIFAHQDLFLAEGSGKERGALSILGKTIRLDVRGFFQSNIQVLEKLLATLLDFADASKVGSSEGGTALDLYGGVGTFGVFLSDRFDRVDLMERDKSSVALAAENLRGTHAQFFAFSDEVWAKSQEAARVKPRFVVVDPPRAGLSKSLRTWLTEKKPPALAYVSCDPVTLARDLRHLVDAGFQVQRCDVYDFYPQTAHIESLVLLKGPQG